MATVKIDDRAVLAAFKKLATVTQAANLETAVRAGGLPIINEAVELSPKLTGTNARSIQQNITERGNGRIHSEIGPSTVYGARLEFGYSDTDSLGRTYNQPPRPYMRPAYDHNKAEAQNEVRDVLRDLVLRAAG